LIMRSRYYGEKLLWIAKKSDRFEVALDTIVDDVTFTKRGTVSLLSVRAVTVFPAELTGCSRKWTRSFVVASDSSERRGTPRELHTVTAGSRFSIPRGRA
jgi:hypothetical protein